MRYFIKTFGCAMNTSDSERIAAFLESRGFLLSEKIDQANLVVFNTCGIKQTAENRAYSMIHALKAKSYKLKAIILTGCLANRRDVQKRLKDKVDLFTEIKDFPKNVESIMYNVSSINTKKIPDTCYMIHDTKKPDANKQINYLSINPNHSSKHTAHVPIMTGCNNFCSYCVVPHARGREISRPADEILSEIKSLIKNNYKHIILLGQNVNSYASQVHKVYKVHNVRKEKTENINFSGLLKMIDKIPGRFWISFVSSHPKDFSDELIETIAKCQKVCEWVHLPIQAGNDKILEKMNRRYTQAHYLRLIRKIRKKFVEIRGKSVPISVSSDIIVGFPGETKKQFMDSAKVMEKCRFDMVFFGQFSPRPETVAFQMKDNVSKEEKSRREKFLNEILKKTTSENNQKYVGRTVEILIEKAKPSSEGLAFGKVYFGKTRTMKNVKIVSNKKNLVGKIIKVKITRANIWNLESNF